MFEAPVVMPTEQELIGETVNRSGKLREVHYPQSFDCEAAAPNPSRMVDARDGTLNLNMSGRHATVG